MNAVLIGSIVLIAHNFFYRNLAKSKERSVGTWLKIMLVNGWNALITSLNASRYTTPLHFLHLLRFRYVRNGPLYFKGVGVARQFPNKFPAQQKVLKKSCKGSHEKQSTQQVFSTTWILFAQAIVY